jgi:endo-1,4-beta-D-glucanase Y
MACSLTGDPGGSSGDSGGGTDPTGADAGAIPMAGGGGSPSVRSDASLATAQPDGATQPVDASLSRPTRGPSPPANGSNFPFPQNRESGHCVYPTAYRNEDVSAAYAQWKNDTVTSAGAGGFQRVQRTVSDATLALNSTVSEGIGYGMLIAVFMNDPSLFDNLWKYEQLHLDKNGLMDWYVAADGSMSLGVGGATDADEDMAFALVMADKQWGGQGSLGKSYHQTAIDQMTNVWVHEVLDSNLMLPGDTWGDSSTVNISYFAPAYYRVFKEVGGTLGTYNPTWDAAIDTVYNTIGAALNSSSGNESNGLVPAWCTTSGMPNGGAIFMTGNPTNYQYDSCRTPFRIALDWCWNAEPRAQAYLAKTSAFFSGVGVANIVDGYALDGMPQPQNMGKQSAAFIGPAGVGAMSSASYRSFLDGAYGAVSTRSLLAGGAYYEESWTVMSLLMMSANFLDYTALH